MQKEFGGSLLGERFLLPLRFSVVRRSGAVRGTR